MPLVDFPHSHYNVNIIFLFQIHDLVIELLWQVMGKTFTDFDIWTRDSKELNSHLQMHSLGAVHTESIVIF